MEIIISKGEVIFSNKIKIWLTSIILNYYFDVRLGTLFLKRN